MCAGLWVVIFGGFKGAWVWIYGLMVCVGVWVMMMVSACECCRCEGMLVCEWYGVGLWVYW